MEYGHNFCPKCEKKLKNQKLLGKKDRNNFLNDKFYFKMINSTSKSCMIPLQTQHFPDMRFPNSTFFPCILVRCLFANNLTSLAVLVPDFVLDMNTLSSLMMMSCTSWKAVLLATSPVFQELLKLYLACLY